MNFLFDYVLASDFILFSLTNLPNLPESRWRNPGNIGGIPFFGKKLGINSNIILGYMK